LKPERGFIDPTMPADFRGFVCRGLIEATINEMIAFGRRS
jgi:hypothetical protein